MVDERRETSREQGSRERGRRAAFDPRDGAVHGSGSGAGAGGAGDEEYDHDEAGGGAHGHPLPRSEEARSGEIPETLERRKGRGDDPAGLVQPGPVAAEPDGDTYAYGDAGRGPESVGKGEGTEGKVDR